MLFTNTQLNTFAKDPAVVRFHGQYILYYSQLCDDGRFGVGIAVSQDMENWELHGEVPIEEPYEANGIAAPGAVVLEDRVHLFYQTYGNLEKDAICHASSDDGFHFVKNPENPVFSPDPTWCVGRAIDADLCVFRGRLHMYFASRDHEMKIQKVGGAWAKLDSGFGRGAWTMLAQQSLLAPELAWEGECIEAPATVVEDGKIYMFYGGSYNCTPQQIGCAVSEDGVFFRRVSLEPFMRPGDPGAWNSSESGHPYAFRDDDGRVYLFYQGSPDMGKTWYLSRVEVGFKKGMPVLIEEGSVPAAEEKNVLLLGDSRRMGYEPFVREKLEGKAKVFAPRENGRWAGYTLNSLRFWMREFPKPDVVHWNCGLWDLGDDYGLGRPFQLPEEYEGTVERTVKVLRKLFPGVKIVLATTMRVYDQDTEGIERYNAILCRVAEREGIPVDDLFTLMKDRMTEYDSGDHLHLNDAGNEIVAAQVVEAIKQVWGE